MNFQTIYRIILVILFLSGCGKGWSSDVRPQLYALNSRVPRGPGALPPIPDGAPIPRSSPPRRVAGQALGGDALPPPESQHMDFLVFCARRVPCDSNAIPGNSADYFRVGGGIIFCVPNGVWNSDPLSARNAILDSVNPKEFRAQTWNLDKCNPHILPIKDGKLTVIFCPGEEDFDRYRGLFVSRSLPYRCFPFRSN